MNRRSRTKALTIGVIDKEHFNKEHFCCIATEACQQVDKMISRKSATVRDIEVPSAVANVLSRAGSQRALVPCRLKVLIPLLPSGKNAIRSSRPEL